MKTKCLLRFLPLALSAIISLPILAADPAVPTTTITVPPATNAPAAAPAAAPAPPPSAPPKLGAAELEKLLMPIALFPDPLLATMLPASVYPLEIVQAARFVQDTNNIPKVDEQNWDENVKAVAKIPGAIKKLNDDLQWTIQLGEAFVNQDKDVMDTIQALRLKANKANTLHTTEQQTVIVTNMVVEKTVEQQTVVVTNTIVQIQPSNPQTVYVPSYPPTVYYPPPAYVYDPFVPLMTFTAGVAMGAIIANNCDWHHGGCYGGGNANINIDNSNNFNSSRNNVNSGNRANNTGNRANTQGAGGKKWQPDPARVKSSGSPGAAKSMESRGYGSTGAGGARAGGPSASARPAGGGPSAAARPAGGGPSAAARPAGGGAAGGARPSASPAAGGGARPSASPSVSSGSAGNRAGGGASASPAARSGGGGSAFSGGGGGGGGGRISQSSASQRGSASRGGGGGGRGGGGGGRGGGGRR